MTFYHLYYEQISHCIAVFPAGSSGSPYSPLFVDLIDSYNQHNYLSLYPDDIIENVSFYTILQMAKEADDLMDIRSILISEICPPYSPTQIDSQLSVYSSLF